jgi:pilus assembly protein CpaB
MSPRRIIFILVALLASGATIFLGRAWLIAERNARLAQQEQPAPAPEKPKTMILVAKGDLHVGEFLHARDNLRWQAWPDDSLSPNYVRSTDHQLEDYEGSVVKVALNDGEPVTDLRIVRAGDRSFLAAVLDPGMRAVTIPVTPASGMAGHVFPGDYVDLIATLKLMDPKQGKDDNDDDREHHAGETVLTNLKVLALDQRVDDQNKELTIAKTATLQVTPKEAEAIAVVAEIAKLSLSLRSLNEGDGLAQAETGRTGPSYTFDSDATQLTRPPAFAGNTHRVVIVRGADVSQMEFTRVR